jgi:hypothetical protein
LAGAESRDALLQRLAVLHLRDDEIIALSLVTLQALIGFRRIGLANGASLAGQGVEQPAEPLCEAESDRSPVLRLVALFLLEPETLTLCAVLADKRFARLIQAVRNLLACRSLVCRMKLCSFSVTLLFSSALRSETEGS